MNRQQMRLYIDALSQAVTHFEKNNARKLIFFNDLCFYDHLRRFPPECGIQDIDSVDELLDTLEPYIPLPLTEDNFNLFIRAASETDNPQLPDYFTRQARVDFVSMLRRADTPERREWLINLCDAIRVLKNNVAGLV